MSFKLIESAEKRWKRLKGYKKLAEVIQGVVFKDGKKIEKPEDQKGYAA